MVRARQYIGLALLMVLSGSALMAPSARANLRVTPSQYPVYLTGVATHPQVLLTSAGLELTCDALRGQTPGIEGFEEESELTFEQVKYEDCLAKLGASTLPVTINMTGCDYRLHGGVEDTSGHFVEGKLDLVCPKGVTGPDVTLYSGASQHAEKKSLCVYTVSAGNNLGSVTYTNLSDGQDYVEVKLINVATPISRDGSVLCGSPGVSSGMNVDVTLTGFNPENELGGSSRQVDLAIKGGMFVPTWYPASVSFANVEHNKTIKAEQVFTSEGKTGHEVKCELATGLSTIKERGSGDVALTVSELHYQKCKAVFESGTVLAIVDMTGCDYVLHLGEGKLDLACPEGTTGPDIRIYTDETPTTVLCTYRMSAFSGHEKVTYESNTAGIDDIKVGINELPIEVSREGSVACGDPSKLKYTGSYTVQAYEDRPSLDITMSS